MTRRDWATLACYLLLLLGWFAFIYHRLGWAGVAFNGLVALPLGVVIGSAVPVLRGKWSRRRR
jgi:hypothetical protein